jgi:DNA repair protein RadC
MLQFQQGRWFAVEHEGHRQRLRERFESEGLGSFAPHEALELLLTYAIPRRDTNPLAHQLIRHFGSLQTVLEASPQDLLQVKGIGKSAAALIGMQLPLSRMYQLNCLKERICVADRGQLLLYCHSLIGGARNELFYAISLDSRMRVLNASLIAQGDVGEVAVYPRLVLSSLLSVNASGAILLHNHPSGDPAPSGEDAVLTSRIANVLSGVGITLYDHIIVSGGNSYSFRETGAHIGENGRDQPALQPAGAQKAADTGGKAIKTCPENTREDA